MVDVLTGTYKGKRAILEALPLLMNAGANVEGLEIFFLASDCSDGTDLTMEVTLSDTGFYTVELNGKNFKITCF